MAIIGPNGSGRKAVFPRTSVMDNLLLGSYIQKNRAEAKEDLNKIFDTIVAINQLRYNGYARGAECQSGVAYCETGGMSLRPESLSLRMRQNVCWTIRR